MFGPQSKNLPIELGLQWRFWAVNSIRPWSFVSFCFPFWAVVAVVEKRSFSVQPQPELVLGPQQLQ